MRGWRQQCGQRGEQMAVAYLQAQGYRIEQQNYRCREGEIDIIAWDGSTLVFVEVKTKTHLAFGSPEAMVTRPKQRKMTQVAMLYVTQRRLPQVNIRFDVVAIVLSAQGSPALTHVAAAFTPAGHFMY
jgi:putative endonuclease